MVTALRRRRMAARSRWVWSTLLVCGCRWLRGRWKRRWKAASAMASQKGSETATKCSKAVRDMPVRAGSVSIMVRAGSVR